jgi:hypothetical protein
MPQRLQWRDQGWALALSLAWSLGLSAALHGFVVHDYLPLGDQWALVANSYPGQAQPLQWFTRGFADYFESYPGLSPPYADFVRPGFNFTYWMLGHFMAPVSGAYLYLNYAAIGACAGLCYLVMRQGGTAPALALPLAAAVPLMPAMVPVLSTLLSPPQAYDPLAAALALLVLLSWPLRRPWLSAALLLAAVLTKETTLPLAAALPLLYVLEHCRELRTQPRRWLEALLLGLPLLLWLGLRLAAFGGVSNGTYVLEANAGGLLHNLVKLGLRWPFWIDILPLRQGSEGLAALPSWLLLAANLGLMLAAAGIVSLRLLRRHETPHAAEACLLLSFGFMCLVGVAPRYGAVLDVCLVACIGQWLAQRSAPRLTAVPALSLIAGLAVTDLQAWQNWPERYALVRDYAAIGRQYLAALKAYPAGERVLVLNDPISWHSQERWLRSAAGIDAEVVKLADFACPGSALRLRQVCAVALRRQTGAPQFEFTQSCGIEVCGSFVAPPQPLHFEAAPGFAVDLSAQAPGETGRGGDPPQWRTLRFTSGAGPTHLLYFDPASRSFRRYDAAADAATTDRAETLP